MNCGPWSVHTLSGTPVRQTDDFKDNMSFAVVVLVIIGVISGQSEKQSTVMRYCCPVCEQKSIAASWNGCWGVGLRVMVFFCCNGRSPDIVYMRVLCYLCRCPYLANRQ